MCIKGYTTIAHLVVMLLQSSPESGADAEKGFLWVLGVGWPDRGLAPCLLIVVIAAINEGPIDKFFQEVRVLRLGEESGEVGPGKNGINLYCLLYMFLILLVIILIAHKYLPHHDHGQAFYCKSTLVLSF